MSVYSTVNITRKDAIKVLKKTIKECTNKELEELLFDLIGSEFSKKRTLNNFIIVSEYDEDDQSRNWKGKPRKSDDF